MKLDSTLPVEPLKKERCGVCGMMTPDFWSFLDKKHICSPCLWDGLTWAAKQARKERESRLLGEI